jgi:hypothetical protein
MCNRSEMYKTSKEIIQIQAYLYKMLNLLKPAGYVIHQQV